MLMILTKWSKMRKAMGGRSAATDSLSGSITVRLATRKNDRLACGETTLWQEVSQLRLAGSTLAGGQGEELV